MDISVSLFMSVSENTLVCFFLKPTLLLSNLFHLQQHVVWRISLLLIALSQIQNKYVILLLEVVIYIFVFKD